MGLKKDEFKSLEFMASNENVMTDIFEHLQSTFTKQCSHPDIKALMDKHPDDWASNSHITQQIFTILDDTSQLFSLAFPITLSSSETTAIFSPQPPQVKEEEQVLTDVDQEALKRLKLAAIGRSTDQPQTTTNNKTNKRPSPSSIC
jgi:hypothetical protein